MGSLLPDSNSKVGRRLRFKPMFFVRRIENTAAASVEETIDPNNKPSSSVKSDIRLTNIPTARAVISTLSVDKEIPRHKIGFILSHLVSKPPEKIIKANEMAPNDSAAL